MKKNKTAVVIMISIFTTSFLMVILLVFKPSDKHMVDSTMSKEAVSPLSEAVLNSVWYDIGPSGEAMNIIYMASEGGQSCAFRPHIGKAERVGGAIFLSDADLERWTKLFQVMETNGVVPKLPVVFLDGEYESKVDFDNVTLVRKTPSGHFADNEVILRGAFGIRPYEGLTFRITEIKRPGMPPKLYPVPVADPVQGRLGYVVLRLR